MAEFIIKGEKPQQQTEFYIASDADDTGDINIYANDELIAWIDKRTGRLYRSVIAVSTQVQLPGLEFNADGKLSVVGVD